MAAQGIRHRSLPRKLTIDAGEVQSQGTGLRRRMIGDQPGVTRAGRRIWPTAGSAQPGSAARKAQENSRYNLTRRRVKIHRFPEEEYQRDTKT
jgi:hypothetical protein